MFNSDRITAWDITGKDRIAAFPSENNGHVHFLVGYWVDGVDDVISDVTMIRTEPAAALKFADELREMALRMLRDE